jgi:HEAT repeat protein
MDIANALDVLGDARAVPALIAVLAPENQEEPDRVTAMMYDTAGARYRAAMALGAFDTADSKQALLKGLENPRIHLACAGALYRLTGDAKYRAVLEKAAEQDDIHAWRVLKQLTNKLSEDQTLTVTLQQLEERLKANAKTRRE